VDRTARLKVASGFLYTAGQRRTGKEKNKVALAYEAKASLDRKLRTLPPFSLPPPLSRNEK
jgi:hypothetical protein